MRNKTTTTTPVDFKKLELKTKAFNDGDFIPSRYTCEGKDVNPAIDIFKIPEGTKSLAIVVEDGDSPRKLVHWVMWNIPVTNHLRESEASGLQGLNDFGNHRYDGPCPTQGTHRYYFRVFALDCLFDLPVSGGRENLELAIVDHILGYGELMGQYKLKTPGVKREGFKVKAAIPSLKSRNLIL